MTELKILKEPHQMNKDPVLFDNEELYFYQGQYDDGTTAIFSETKSRDFYAEVSIDISEHNKHGLKYNEIIFNPKLSHEFKCMFYGIFSNNIEQNYDDCPIIEYGFSCSNIIEVLPSLLIKTYDGVISDY